MTTAGQNKGFHQIQRKLRHSIIWNSHQTKETMRSLLGMVNYLNMYSALSTHLTASLSALTHQDMDYKPSNAHYENFNRLKMEVSNMRALPHFDVNADTTLQMDASKKGLGEYQIKKGKVIWKSSTTSCMERNSHLKPTRNNL